MAVVAVLNGTSVFGMSEQVLSGSGPRDDAPAVFRVPSTAEQVFTYTDALRAHPLCIDPPW